MVPPDAADATLPSADELRAEEEARHMRREAEIERSWSKEVVVEGGGRQAWPGARATLHVVSTVVSSRSGEGVGSVFEDSRPLGVPRLLLLGRGILVPGLERAVGGMREGESARVVVQPEGAYGDAGSPAAPRVPGSAVVTYEVELVKLEEEAELWDLSFDDKLRLAAERRERGNALYRGLAFAAADEEYEQGMRYLVYMPQPEDGQLAPLEEATVRMQLNLCAAKLRTGREAAALAHADKVLELRPEHPKALYRKGQAHTQLGAYAEASLALTRAKAAAEAEADSSAAAAVEKEEARLAERRQRHARQRKAAYRRMVGGGAGEARGEANAEAADQPRAAAGGGLRVGVAAAVLVAAGAVALAAAALASSWG
ncbi:hypothetical protein EMIHUDRAFT_452341, partial [Emiliania huxleyi CCMP1516]|uniref:peptidylprolyl isomerase n=2 Tax=Emiliania huxleyi TaxID=2903 RepID=A0A0D3IKW5_EMIH1